jgi:4-hydroxythreonine-4-phosphate dehydrogenase
MASTVEMAPPPLLLTLGEPAGIGPDITLHAWEQRHERALPVFALVGCVATLTDRAQRLGARTPIRPVASPAEAVGAFSTALPVIDIPCDAHVSPGTPSDHTAAAVIRAIERGVEAVWAGQASALVTNPIAKSVLYKAGFRHAGHTEFLAELAGRHGGTVAPHPVMMLACDTLRVVPLTIHVPLATVPGLITTDRLRQTILTTNAALQSDFGIDRPRIAVCGLNPHAGENGSIGREDADIIAPALQALRHEGCDVTGPLSADTMFHAGARARYDAAIAMYHDQALIPIKTLAFESGVNVTLGLPFVRTSPDHGTAFDIAGTGRASAESLIAALHLARDMASRRRAAALRQRA